MIVRSSLLFNKRLGVEPIRITSLHWVHKDQHYRDMSRKEEDREKIKRSCRIIRQVALYTKCASVEIADAAA
jgi:hypothetical protein